MRISLDRRLGYVALAAVAYAGLTYLGPPTRHPEPQQQKAAWRSAGATLVPEIARTYASVAVANGGTRVALRSKAGIEIWDGDRLQRVLPWKLDPYGFTANGRHLVASSNGHAWVWDSQTDTSFSPPLSGDLALQMTLHPRYSKLVETGWRQRPQWVDLDTHRVEMLGPAIEYVNCLAASPVSLAVTVGSGNELTALSPDGHSHTVSGIYEGVAYSADGTHIVAWGHRGMATHACEFSADLRERRTLPPPLTVLTPLYGNPIAWLSAWDDNIGIQQSASGTLGSARLSLEMAGPGTPAYSMYQNRLISTSLDGGSMAICNSNGGCMVYRLPSFNTIQRIGGHGTELRAVVGLRGTRLAVQTRHALVTWDMKAHTYRRFPFDVEGTAARTSPGASTVLLAARGACRQLKIVRFDEKLQPRVSETRKLYPASGIQRVTDDGRVLARLQAGRVEMVDLETGESFTTPLSKAVQVADAVAIPHGVALAGFDSSRLHRPTDTGITVVRADSRTAAEYTVARRRRHLPLNPAGYIPGLDLIVTSCGELFDLKTQQITGLLEEFMNASKHYYASPDGSTLVGQGLEISISDPRTRRQRALLHEFETSIEVISPDSRMLVLRGEQSDIVSFYDLRKNVMVGRLCFYNNATDWCFISADGRVEATEGALDEASITVDGHVTRLADLAEVNTPGLLAEILSPAR